MGQYYTVVTEKGIEELNSSIQTNKCFNATKMAVGDSNGNYYEPEKTQIYLKNQKYISNIYAQGKKDDYLYFDLQLPPSLGDFYIREVGLFDDDLNLLAVAKYPETYKTKADDSSEKTLNIEIRIKLSTEAFNTIIIDNSGELATREVLEEYQKLDEKGAANGYTPLNAESLIPQKHIPFPYNVFCINTGVVNTSGNPAFLSLSDSVLTTSGSFDVTTANGKTYTINDILTLDIYSLTAGEYNIFINPVTKVISLKNNTIFTGGVFPSTASVGDYLLNTSQMPYDLEEKTSSGTSSGLNEVLVGTLTMSVSGGNLKMNGYNQNLLDILKETLFSQKANIDLSNLSNAGNSYINQSKHSKQAI